MEYGTVATQMETATNWAVTTIPGVLLLSIIGGLLAWLIVAAFLSKHEAAVRAYAERTPKSFVRWLYFRLIIETIKGKGHLTEFYVLCLLLGLGLTGVWKNSSEMVERARNLVVRANAFGVDAPHPTSNETAKEIADIRIESAKAEKQLVWTLRFTEVLCLYLGFIWMPYAIMRHMITYEYDRLMTRLPGVVSKDEFRDLCRAELKVSNKETLNAFLVSLHALTQKYQLASVFYPQ